MVDVSSTKSRGDVRSRSSAHANQARPTTSLAGSDTRRAQSLRWFGRSRATEWSSALGRPEQTERTIGSTLTGRLLPDSDLVIVDAEHVGVVWHLLEHPKVRADIAWLTELRDSRRGALLSIEPGDPGATRGILEALRGRGAQAERLTLGTTTP